MTSNLDQGTGHSCGYTINRLKSEILNGQNWQTIVNSNTPWVDTSFPVTDAMYWADPGYSSGALSSYYSAIWNRSMALPNAEIIGTSNLFNDIDQGALGDCYFLSSLSALGEWGTRL